MTKVEQAAAAFESGFSCSQSVLSTYCGDFGLDPTLGLRLASPFGGGIGHTGNLCGAVTGALMVIGLAHGRSVATDMAAQDRTNELVHEFLSRFTQRHESIVCNTLLGVDLSTPTGTRQFLDRKLRSAVCAGLVRDAAGILEQLLHASGTPERSTLS